MIPILPIALVGGTVLIVKKLRGQETIVAKLTRLDSPVARPATLIEKIDSHYQAFFQTKIDPLFSYKQRGQQMQEFAGKYNEDEAETNRRLGMALANIKLAMLGAVVYPPLSWVSALNVVLIMWPMTRRGIQTLLREKRLKYTLVAILSVWSSIAAGYYVVSSLMAVVVFSTYKLTARTEAYSRAALTGAYILQPPETVWIQQPAGIETQIPFKHLQIGDTIVLSAGQTVPVDGVITEGMATLDLRILTGELHAAEKSVGGRVLANTLLLSGKIYVRVEQTGDDTAAAQIGKLLGNMEMHTLDHEARSEKFVDKLTLPVLSASALAMLTIGPAGAAAIMNSGFGSVMFFSGPLSMLSHLNLAVHQGILVKEGRALEKLHEVDTVVFDKTGTLELQAQLRPETQEMVHKLHQRGLKLCLLSGDNLQSSQHLAERLGIDDVYADVPPEGKADMIRQLQAAGRTVCFVGDGINDAIALQQADVSVSLCGVASVASDNAQIVLMGQSLQQLEQLFGLADGFNKNLDQTMRMAYIPGTVLIGGVFLLHFGMTAALVMYSGGVLAAMGKALSPLRQLSKTKG